MGEDEWKRADEKWKTSIQTSGYCHKHFYQSENCAQAPDMSLGLKLSIPIKKRSLLVS